MFKIASVSGAPLQIPLWTVWSLRRYPDSLVIRGFLPSEIAVSRLRRLQFSRLARFASRKWLCLPYLARQPRSSGDASGKNLFSIHMILSLTHHVALIIGLSWVAVRWHRSCLEPHNFLYINTGETQRAEH